MLKIAVILVLAVCVYSVQSCGPPCKSGSRRVCAADKKIENCQRLSECELRKENCRRRKSNRPILIQVAGSRCSKLKSRGPCAPIGRGKRNVANCNRIKCVRKETVTEVCARSSGNLCQRVTRCQLNRINCKRGPLNRLKETNINRCKGLKRDEPLQKCRKVSRQD